ncbi:hypothetical protein [Staphylococcus chromogenes]|uniref:hypothetical protein n=1 Tax=Staphylococcus chromogenes TaxID=46126 RepID=UPI00288577E0|nr:hypothetical protein [Staphylococcus chromogenes]MDT0656341.1 hypothetical protein [Staphylococcus chromogenes]MDT0672755.1 hypothetical protein [Staphylococcus chromogenes]MDT0674929.1 hypothetical protein [Staphylococcus chromogenes]MDT0699125.1 hypothetical protein [Staphylococcus chromogenes]
MNRSARERYETEKRQQYYEQERKRQAYIEEEERKRSHYNDKYYRKKQQMENEHGKKGLLFSGIVILIMASFFIFKGCSNPIEENVFNTQNHNQQQTNEQ